MGNTAAMLPTVTADAPTELLPPRSGGVPSTDEPTVLDGRPASVGVPRPVLPERLWISGAPVDWEAVRAAGIDAVVDVDDADAVRDDPAWVSELVLVRSPLVDGPDVDGSASTVEALAAVAAALVRSGRRVLVHCGWGRNRSGLVVSCTVADLLGVSGAEALEVVRRAQPRAVNNPDFAAWLCARPRA